MPISHLRAPQQDVRTAFLPDTLTSSSSSFSVAAAGSCPALWPQKKREELTPGNVLLLCYECSGTLPQSCSPLGFQFRAVFPSSHNLALLSEDTIAAKPPPLLQYRPSSLQTGPSLFCSYFWADCTRFSKWCLPSSLDTQKGEKM